MTHRVLVVLLLLLACGLGWTVWYLADGGSATQPVRRERLERAEAPRTAADLRTPERDPVRPAPAVRIETPEPGRRAAVTGPPPKPCEVRVVDERGVPIVRAEVRFLDDGEPAFTDDDGRCVVLPSSADDSLHVRAQGFRHRNLREPPESSVTVVMTRLVPVFGTVVEAGTLEPIAAAEVRPLEPTCPICGSRAVYSDGLGAYAFDGFPMDERVGLSASAPGFLTQKTFLEVRDATPVEMKLTLRRGAELRFEFFDLLTNAPVEHVRVHGAMGPRSDETGFWTSSEFVGLHEFEKRVTVARRDYASTAFTIKAQDLEAATVLRIPMAPLRVARGRVVDPRGTPLEDVRVFLTVDAHDEAEATWRRSFDAALRQPPRNVKFLANPNRNHRTDAAGEFELQGLPPWSREVEVRLTREGYQPRREQVAIAPGTEAWWSEWTLTPLGENTGTAVGRIRGRLTLNGEPVGGTVTWVGAQRRGTEQIDAAGSFLIEDAEPGSVRLFPAPSGFPSESPGCDGLLSAPRTVEVVAGGTATVDLDLEIPMAAISGYVRYPDGKPVPGAAVVGRAEGACGQSGVFADGDGAWSLDLPAGARSASLQAFESQPGRFSTTVIGPAPDATSPAMRQGVPLGSTDIVLVVERTTIQRLRVVDEPTGLPIAKFEMRWQRPDWRDARRYPSSLLGLPDAQGWFEVEMPEGRFDLAISTYDEDPEAQPAFARGQDSRAGRPIELTVRRGESISMRLARNEEPWPKDTEIFLLAADELDAVRWDEASGRTVPGDLSTGHPAHQARRVRFSNRTAQVTGLAPGRYRFVAFPDDVVVEPPSLVAGEDTKIVRWRRR